MDCKTRVGIDLHIHSTASDGTLSPSEILSLANKIGLGAIAITDHDTIDGTRTALSSTPRPAIRLISGVEISTEFPETFACSESCHILGYGFDPEDPELTQALTTLQAARKNRNPQIIERLQTLGFDITLQEVQAAKTGAGQLGRPHIARVLLEKEYVQSINEAFDKYLANGQPAYVDKYRLPCAQALEMIIQAGGIPVLAHPGLIPIKDPHQMEAFVGLLKSLGLQGLEVYYPEHDRKLTAFYEALAQRYDLLMTGGSDFHGAIKPEIKMGIGYGSMFVPFELYARLQQALEQNSA